MTEEDLLVKIAAGGRGCRSSGLGRRRAWATAGGRTGGVGCGASAGVDGESLGGVGSERFGGVVHLVPASILSLPPNDGGLELELRATVGVPGEGDEGFVSVVGVREIGPLVGASALEAADGSERDALGPGEDADELETALHSRRRPESDGGRAVGVAGGAEPEPIRPSHASVPSVGRRDCKLSLWRGD